MTLSRIVLFGVKRDIYGLPITVLYKASDVYRTKMGALTTLLNLNTLELRPGFKHATT